MSTDRTKHAILKIKSMMNLPCLKDVVDAILELDMRLSKLEDEMKKENKDVPV